MFASIRELGEGEARGADHDPSCDHRAQGLTGVGFNSATAPACCTALACSG